VAAGPGRERSTGAGLTRRLNAGLVVSGDARRSSGAPARLDAAAAGG